MSVPTLNHRKDLTSCMRWSLVVGGITSIVCIFGGVVSPLQFFHAYLFAYLFFLGMSLGSLALVMIYHLTGGAWGLLVRRIAEAQMKTLPLMALLFAPIGFGVRYIYGWANLSPPATDEYRTLQERYLQPEMFGWRAVGYFFVWLVLAFLLSAWSRKQDESNDAATAWKCYKLSGFGALAFGIMLHFAAVDWIMSLDSKFTSTIFGPLVFTGQLLSAYAACVAVFCWLARRPEYEHIVSTKAINDLGSLLFTLLILWAYMVWFQFMLIWIADLPRGTTWYLVRLHGGWNWLVLALLLFHFIIPFFMLLLRAVKRNPMLLGSVATLILITQLIFMYLQIIPAFPTSGPLDHWMDAIAPLGVGGIWLGCFLLMLRRRPLLPRYDLNFAQAILLHKLDEEDAARMETLAHA